MLVWSARVNKVLGTTTLYHLDFCGSYSLLAVLPRPAPDMMFDRKLIERGIDAPSFETLEKMAKGLSVELRDLLDFRDGL